MDLQHVEGFHPAELPVVPSPVADDHPTGGGVDAGGERGRRGDALDQAVAERVLDAGAVLAPEPRVVEGRPLLDRVREVGGGVGVGAGPDLVGEFAELIALVVGESGSGHVGELPGGGLGVAPGVDEDERGAALSVLLGVERVGDEPGGLVLAALDGYLPLAAVGEVDGVAEVDAHPEVDGTPVGLDQLGVEPLGDHVGVADGRRERDRLEPGVHLAELREGHFESRAAVRVVDQVDLVAHDAGEVVDPRRAVTDQRVDLLRGGDDDVTRGEPLAVGLVVAGGDADGDAELLPALELGLLLAGERAQGTM